MGRCGTLLAVVAGLFVLLAPSPAFADPAGPTDDRSEVLSIEPATPSIEVEVLGGDSFLELTVERGTEVIVLGVNAEEYLWFRADGTVLENQNAPSTYLNQDRYGGGELPPNAFPDAEPDWEEVASGGRYSWHEHRAHWMQTIRPVGASVGDRIVEGVVVMLVDGEEVEVTVISTWLAEPSPIPPAVGAIGAAGFVGFAFWRWRSQAAWSAVALPLALSAVLAGAAQYWSLPSETGPRLVWIALPALAVVAAIVAVVATARGATFAARGAALVAGVQLLIWGFVKRDGITAAIVPTSAPGWFDRLVTAGAIAGGLALTALALWTLFAPQRRAAST